MEGRGRVVGIVYCVIANAADEAMALHLHIDRCGHQELDTAAEGVDVNLLVLCDDGLAQVHSDASAKSVEPGSVERLAVIDVFVAAIVNRASDALAVLAYGKRAL